jgi:hypothetical protein
LLVADIWRHMSNDLVDLSKIHSSMELSRLLDEEKITGNDYVYRLLQLPHDFCNPDIPGDEEAFWIRSAERDRKRRGEI